MSDFQNLPIITDVGRIALRNVIDSGTPKFAITHFAVGTGGYSATNVFSATSPDPGSVALENEIFRSANVLRVDRDAFTRVYVCTINRGEAIGALGELGLFATYLEGPNAGELFLFALIHFSAKSKTADDKLKIGIPVLT